LGVSPELEQRRKAAIQAIFEEEWRDENVSLNLLSEAGEEVCYPIA